MIRERRLCEEPKGEATLQPRTATTPPSCPNYDEREYFVISIKERLQEPRTATTPPQLP
jgi:hypothetical protein